ncbi:MAG: N-acetylmuramoyl-L-alanine amidase [Clostridia bacterium]|nr:N-acetylmuramoyl-L-alanine amidase [Clostridia bacterium]
MESYDKTYIVKFVFCIFIIVCFIFAFGFIFSSVIERAKPSQTLAEAYEGYVLVIDAGHGGEDAGAVAEDGTLEKDLNLEIASLIRVLCDLNGTRAVMTREDDRLLYDHYDELDDYTGHKKEYDLKNRVKIANELENPIFISVHMNKFAQTKYSGTQIYYSKNNPSSQLLARGIQNMTRAYAQPSNKRPIKQADSSIFVLNKLECPAVLVECGFISNEAELELLKTSEHQAKMSLIIFLSAISMS